MAERKRKATAPAVPEIPFSEALARLIQTDPKEIADLMERVKRQEKDVDRYVGERERSIRSGARRTGKRFRI
jgi:hypothetical protein